MLQGAKRVYEKPTDEMYEAGLRYIHAHGNAWSVNDLWTIMYRACPTVHASDCAVHNEPAMPNGPCDCGA